MAVTFPNRSGRHPQRLAMFEELAKGITGDGQVAASIKGLVGAFKEVTELQARVAKDEMSTPGARLVKVAKATRSKVIPLLEGLERALESVSERKAHLRAEIDKVYNPPQPSYETVLRRQEIRAYFRGLPPAQALAAVEAARKAGDEDTLIALVGPQRYLSNLPQDIWQHGRDHLIEQHAPEQAAALSKFAEVEELAGLFRNEIGQSLADMIDFQKADEIIAAAREDAAAA